MTNKGFFKPKNPQKYKGNPTQIIYRSSWECRVMNFLDNNPSVIQWSSEEIVIPYLSPIDRKVHRYFPDFYIKVKDKNNNIKEMIWEIKPKKQSSQPKKQSRITQKYINEVVTWGINEAKWKAAQEYCLDRGWQFKVLTEEDIGIK
jgi:hypothetical protein